ncbi:DNA-binding protein [archaeon SCG-AAA382B04]|nr:DNA-binding protein [archaeon SCG-AAA382B04]
MEIDRCRRIKRTIKQMKVILDTNMLMTPEQFGINLFSELDRVINKKYQPILPKSILNEIQNIYENGKGENKRAASIALDLINDCEIIETEEEGDDAIMEVAKKYESAVASNDSELIKRLKNNNIPVIILRQQSHLEMN